MFNKMKGLALSIESIEKELKARVEQTSRSSVLTVSVGDQNQNQNDPTKAIVCFCCSHLNHLAADHLKAVIEVSIQTEVISMVMVIILASREWKTHLN